MLILTRQLGEAIDIGSDVEITVLDISGDHVRLGVRAPREVLVLRHELKVAVEEQNRLAATSSSRGPINIMRKLKPAQLGADPEGK